MTITALRNSPTDRPNHWLSHDGENVAFSRNRRRDRVCIVSETCSVSKRAKGVSGFPELRVNVDCYCSTPVLLQKMDSS